MFDIPDAKSVRRSELATRSQSVSPAPSSPDPSLEKAFQAQLAALYGPISSAPAPIHNSNESSDSTQHDEAADTQLKEQEFEFRLFSSAPAPTATAKETADTIIQKILLNDSDSEDGAREGRFLRPRPLSYYFAASLSEERKKEYEFAALDGETVLELAKRRAWGLEVPWRVKVLKTVSSGKVKAGLPDTAIRIEAQDEEDARDKKKRKPGKRRRIILREKRRKKEAAEERRKKREEEKEVAEREKRTRRNREKKVKKRMKEKAKKLGAGNGSVAVEGEGRENGGAGDVSVSGDD
ncbi:hypothetical protein EG329_001925 [Mollisiaceae sp. DMI_Dod_QoI]|nr:hypothetical protein EG329_001925 [Helotiales sp. DMI_Dod_QoI]